MRETLAALALGLFAGAGSISSAQEPPALPSKIIGEVDAESAKSYVEKLASFGTRHTLAETESEERGIGAARRWIHAELARISAESGGRLQVYNEPFERVVGRGGGEPAELVNVLAVLPGTRPGAEQRYYYVLGHYDSRAGRGRDATSDAPGANDDASGTAVVLELARVLADEELDATVVFLATVAEEQGLFGARHHVTTALEDGVDIRAALSNDIVGDPSGPPDASGQPRSARHRIRVFSEGVPAKADESAIRDIRRLSGEADSPSRQLARFIAEVAELHDTAVKPMLVYRPDRFLRGGDHTPFNERGIPAVRFTEVYENYDRQHQNVREEDGVAYGDVPDHVDGGYLADVARLNGATLVHLANAPSIPSNARLSVRGLANDTTIRWEASPEEDVAGYEVVWRETTSPVWQHAKDVGDVTEATIDLSKDNWFFGVRAYDKDGYRSPVAFPGLGRR